MKIVSWNIERGYEPAGICDFLKGCAADVYLLTEVDRGNRRTAGVDMFERLGEALALPGRFACEFEEHESVWRRIIPQGGPGGGVHGNAVFSRFDLVGYRVVDLPTNEVLRWDGSTIVPELFEPRSGNRIAQLFEIEEAGRALGFINIHLENWRCDWSLRRAQLSRALAERRGEELVLAGDLNPLDGIIKTIGRRRPLHREIPLLRAFLAEHGLVDPFEDRSYTSFNWGSRAKLDWIALSSGLQVVSKENIRTPWSDHNCLIVELYSAERSRRSS